MLGITPCLWFDNEAEDAAKLYTSIFPDSKILNVAYYPEAATEVSGKTAGSVLTVTFELQGQKFDALNGGTDFKFSEAISLTVSCEDQKEVDYYWDKLTSGGGEESMCGWLKDKYGLSWQIVPKQLEEIMADKDQARVERATAAFLTMRKLDIAAILRAADGG